MSDIVKSYMEYLGECKTERQCVDKAIQIAEKAGYKDLNSTEKLSAGDKVYYNKMGKALILFRIGKQCICKGMNILGAHLDSPRLDIKQNPVYESDGLVYFNTHYYGGIKKYQWLAIPLSLCGVVVLKDGSKVEVNIGEDPSDPVFCISDILPHIAQEQMKKTASEIVNAEDLDIIVGSGRLDDKQKKDEKEADKKRILALIEKKYGIKEEDFMSSELEVVPAGKPRYLGFDKNLILGYGQDDRVCSYTSLAALLDTDVCERTSCCILADKEEIGSEGATGMNSHLLDNAVAEVVERLETSTSNKELVVRRALANSIMLSSDVNSAYDPLNAGLYDKQNSSYLGRGVVFNKYTGARGKSGASDANPEFMAKIRDILDKKNIKFQTAELAKVDVGGGGTIAHYAAEYGLSVIDCGVSVLSMHAPWEITSVYDVKSVYDCYKAFLEA